MVQSESVCAAASRGIRLGATLRIGRARGAVLGSLLLLVTSFGCGASSEAPIDCLAMPQSCAMGTTCWPADMIGNYRCLQSKSYVALGDDCAVLVGLTTCGDGLICAPMTGRNKVQQTRCTQYCDVSHPCAAQATCMPVALLSTGPQVSVCILPPPA